MGAAAPECRVPSLPPESPERSGNPFELEKSAPARLIWAPIYLRMGRHIMKTTIEIADDLFERAQRLARQEKTTFRSLTEQGLRLVLQARQARPRKLPPLVTVRGQGLTDEFRLAPWDRIRDEIYRGHGG